MGTVISILIAIDGYFIFKCYKLAKEIGGYEL